MKVQFINPLLGGDFSTLDISITALATYLNERTNHKSTIVDMTFHTKDWKKHLHRNIKKEKPDVIAMSTNTMYMQYVKRIAKEIKKKYDIPIITGGYHASCHPQDTIDIPTIDAVCIGDGEFAFEKYLDRLEKGKSMKGLQGMWAKEKGKIVRNKGGCFIKDIDQFPIPNWDLWKDLDKYFYYLGMLYFIGTRGCPYNCTNCDAIGIKKAVSGNYFRLRNPESYAEEIAYQYSKYKKRGVRLAQLFDQVFTFDKKWLKQFCDAYRATGVSDEFKFSTFARLDNIDEEKAKMLGKSGCALLRVGIESGDNFIRNEIYKKNLSDSKIKSVFKICKKNGIGFTAFYILGGPAETKKTINKTINLARKLDAERSAFFIYKPFTDEGAKQVVQYGGHIDEELWKAADNITFDAVVHLKDVSPSQVEWYQKKAYFLTFGKRLLGMIKAQKFSYFTHLSTYMYRGIKDGLDYRYLLPYYHIYAYDNVDK